MRTTIAALAALTLAAAACASTAPSQELVDARKAYDQAQRTRAAEYTPTSLASAHQALERAEREHDDEPGSYDERSYAYVAKRRAELAAVEGEAAYARAQKERGAAEYARLEQERIQSLEAEVARLGGVKDAARGTVISMSGEVLFEFGKADLLPTAREKLTKAAKVLAKETGPITVEGHTDAVGNEESNQALSMQRAEAVRVFLVEQGVQAERITVLGLGETKAVASNDTAAGRANNRRVEIVVSEMTPASGQMTPASGKNPEQQKKPERSKP